MVQSPLIQFPWIERSRAYPPSVLFWGRIYFTLWCFITLTTEIQWSGTTERLVIMQNAGVLWSSTSHCAVVWTTVFSQNSSPVTLFLFKNSGLDLCCGDGKIVIDHCFCMETVLMFPYKNSGLRNSRPN